MTDVPVDVTYLVGTKIDGTVTTSTDYEVTKEVTVDKTGTTETITKTD